MTCDYDTVDFLRVSVVEDTATGMAFDNLDACVVEVVQQRRQLFGDCGFGVFLMDFGQQVTGVLRQVFDHMQEGDFSACLVECPGDLYGTGGVTVGIEGDRDKGVLYITSISGRKKNQRPETAVGAPSGR